MKSFLAALAFLTRLPVGNMVAFDAEDVARSAGWFPAVGLSLGASSAGLVLLLRGHLPLLVVAVLLIAVDALVTGALHYDGLADTADGFGGGRNREDVLRIMREHVIGSYGGLAMALLVALKVAAYSTLLTKSDWLLCIMMTPALGRWSILPLSSVLPYAREAESLIDKMGTQTLILGSVMILIALAVARSPRAWMALGVAATVSAAFGWYCRKRIGGVTGDTLGANVQLCESAALLTFLWEGSAR